MIGRQLGEYQIVERLGEGGMGTVYRAVDQMLERDVALKVLRAEVADEPSQLARFRTEAVILAKLHHPNIATLYRLAREGDSLLMAMEFVPGRTLASLVAGRRRLPIVHASSWCCQVLDAMAYAHALGVVHRDLKPANLMVTGNGTVKVTDFGIARALGTGRQTRLGFVIGTPAYMSPEQVRGHDVDGRADLYALGMVLYEMLTGRLPFEAADERALLAAQLTQAAPPPRAWRPELPASFDAAVSRAIAKAPAERFQSASEFRTALEVALAGLTLDQDDPGPLDLPPPRLRAATAPAVAEPSLTARPLMSAEVLVPGTPLPTPPPKATRLAPEVAGAAPGGVKATRLASEGAGSGGRAPSRDAPLVVPPERAMPPAPGGVRRRDPSRGWINPGWLAGASAAARGLNWKHGVGAAAVVVMAAVVTALVVRGPAAPAGPRAASAEGQTAAPAGAATASERVGAAPSLTPVPVPGAMAEPPVVPPAPAGPIAVTRPPGTVKAPPVASVPPRSPPSEPPPAAGTVPPGAASDPPPTPPAAARPAAATPRAGAPAVAETLTFEDVKFLYIEEKKSREIDAILIFDADHLRVLVERNKTVFKVMPYRSISSAVYAQSKHPRWKEGIGAAVLVGVFAAPVFFLKSTQHWLTIQSPDDFVVLRLDRRNYKLVLPALETRTGTAVEVAKPEK